MINEAILIIDMGGGTEVYIVNYHEISRGKPNEDGTRDIELKGECKQVYEESSQIPLRWRG